MILQMKNIKQVKVLDHVLKEPLTVLKLSNRTLRVLNEGKFFTIADLADKYKGEILRNKGLGHGTLKELLQGLHDYGALNLNLTSQQRRNAYRLACPKCEKEGSIQAFVISEKKCSLKLDFSTREVAHKRFPGSTITTLNREYRCSSCKEDLTPTEIKEFNNVTLEE